MDGWMGGIALQLHFESNSPSPLSLSQLGHHYNVNLSATKLERLHGFPSYNNGSSSKRQRFSKCVFLPSATMSKTINCLISLDGKGGGAVTAFLSSFFHIYLNIFLGISTAYLIYMTGEV